jgi:hypothetical protein
MCYNVATMGVGYDERRCGCNVATMDSDVGFSVGYDGAAMVAPLRVWDQNTFLPNQITCP